MGKLSEFKMVRYGLISQEIRTYIYSYQFSLIDKVPKSINGIGIHLFIRIYIH